MIDSFVIFKTGIVTQPVAPAVICAGNGVQTISVSATNATGYAWRRNGVVLPNSTNSTPRFASVVNSFSSEYSTTEWSANQILGAPDVYPAYGDIVGAWASASGDNNREFIQLGFNQAAPISYIDIYETLAAGSIDTIYVKNPNTGLFESVY